VAVATKLVERSPMKFEFITPKSDTMQPLAPSGITSPIHPIETSTPPDDSRRRDTGPMSQRAFVLSIYRSQEYKHRTLIRQSPLHGPWPKAADDIDTFVYDALKQVVPKGSASEALCDWETGDQLSDEVATLRSKSESHSTHRQRRIARSAKVRRVVE